MAIGLQNFPNITTPDGDFPNGRIKDNPGNGTGTPVNQYTNGDYHEFFAKLMRMSGLTPNQVPDSEYAGHQYIQALINEINSSISPAMIQALIGSYTTNDVIILYGCTVFASIPGTSSITAGAVYYNGKIYYVPASSIPSTTGTLVYKINTSGTPYFIYLSNGLSGSGIADYNQSTVKNLFTLLVTRLGLDEFAPEDPTMSAGWTAFGSNANKIKYEKRGQIVYVTGRVQRGTGGTNEICVLPVGFRPARQIYMVQHGIDAASANTFFYCHMDSSGEIRINFSGDISDTEIISFNFSFFVS